ncbi:thiazolylpeptide-type bacteriocin [Kitasatospora sp. NPDC088391]|uniref:thiazolylpeptide-type bacteriocin n=1 Tax=Kitasatospora sp. NPDC088391 TaxID=3364074 RepID=UPI00381A1DB6
MSTEITAVEALDFSDFAIDEIEAVDLPDTVGLPAMGASDGASCCALSCSCCSSSS